MENDPLAVLVKTSDEIAKMRERGELHVPTPHVPKPHVRDYAQLVKLVAFEAALVNRKEKTPEEFFHDFWRVFERECLFEHNWIHTYLTPLRNGHAKPLTEIQKKERSRAANKKWRENNPDYKDHARFRREEAKRRRQGGYAVVTLPTKKEEN